MEMISKILSAPAFWGLATPLIAATVAWFANEHAKRKWAQHERREQKYIALIRAADSFYESASNPIKGREAFLVEVRAAWLYCPDEVIRSINKVLESVRVDSGTTNAEKEKLMGELMLQLRKDQLKPKLIRSTKLKTGDFKHFRVNK